MEYTSLTPYKELRQGDESIHDHAAAGGVSVADEVIAYLRSGNAYIFSPGVYQHPFKEGRLLGPYIYTDNKRYCWDRDTWKYVVKYGLELPQEFVAFVLSEEGAAAFEEMSGGATWSDVIKQWKSQEGSVILLPEDAGDTALDDF